MPLRVRVRTAAMGLLSILAGTLAGAERPFRVAVEAEETVYEYKAPDNGSGPLWCHGSTCLVRVGNRVVASGIETIEEAKPLNNVRWTLYLRGESGWKLWRRDEKERTREPSPLAAFHDGRVFLSVNPTRKPPDSYSGPADPRILELRPDEPEKDCRVLEPLWRGEPPFTEHSYRSLAADGVRGELILLQNIGYTHAEWTFLDREGRWSAQGRLAWPNGKEYPEPQPVRVCYPTVALVDRAVHFCGVSDIIEPYPEWRAYKKELTGRSWDYDFRRLFYTWTDDIRKGSFRDWVEIASRDSTAGWIFPCDLRVAPDGAVHVLWSERAIDERLREKFFPEAKQRIALEHAILRDGKVTARETILEQREGQPGLRPGRGRFHVTADGRLFVIYYASGRDKEGESVSENRLVLLDREGAASEPVSVPLEEPFTAFFTATPRAGSPPSDLIDILGEGGPPRTLRYARLKISR